MRTHRVSAQKRQEAAVGAPAKWLEGEVGQGEQSHCVVRGVAKQSHSGYKDVVSKEHSHD